ncbi:MAG: hypothetical protein LBR79_02715 [Oscillospiraceae bacterium]|nr:hypothetical protein [Oscillospiraceae bacterium]
MNAFYMIDAGFLNKGEYLWCQKVLAKMFKKLEEFKSYGIDEAKEECFEIFLSDMYNAQNIFHAKIKDLPLKMKCRAMCDDKSHFGGQECAEYMKNIRRICETYLKDSAFSDDITEGSIANVITGIKAKARQDETSAWEIEKENKTTYEISGKDNSLSVFRHAGYNI